MLAICSLEKRQSEGNAFECVTRLVYGLIKNRLAPKLGSVNFNHLEHLSLLAINQIVDTLLSKSGFDLLSYCLVLKTLYLSIYRRNIRLRRNP